MACASLRSCLRHQSGEPLWTPPGAGIEPTTNQPNASPIDLVCRTQSPVCKCLYTSVIVRTSLAAKKLIIASAVNKLFFLQQPLISGSTKKKHDLAKSDLTKH